MEAIPPVELEIPSLRVALEDEVNEVEWIRAQHGQLALFDEHQLKATYHHQGYQKRVAKTFNQKVKPRNIKQGDLVLKEIREPIRDPRGKFGKNDWDNMSSRKFAPGMPWYLKNIMDISSTLSPTSID